MEIKLNNQTKSFPNQCTIQQLIEQVMPDRQKGIAVAVNNTVIPLANWQHHLIRQNDTVLIIKATQGG